jgi:uncharacterized phage protein (TIGR02220 family)
MHWFPFYPSDFIGGAIRLSHHERGTYALMLVSYYTIGGPLPLDMVECYRIVGCESDSDRRAVDRVLQCKFIRTEAGFAHERCEEILAQQSAGYLRRSGAAKKRWEMHAMHMQCMSNAPTMHMQPEPEPEPDIKSLTTLSGNRKKSTIETPQNPENQHQEPIPPPVERPDLWDFRVEPSKMHRGHYALAFLNQVTNSRYTASPANLRIAQARAKEYSLKQLRYAINIMWEKWKDNPKMAEYLRPKTLFSALNCAQYVEAARKEVES